MQFRSLIDVRPPYYALHSVTPSASEIRAQVRREHPLGHEVGPLAAAEAGRHLAILGACACSSVREPAALHYYLAHRARIIGYRDPAAEQAREFTASARAVSSTAREARAQAVLRAVGSHALLYELDVTYKVLSRPVFERLFAAHRRDLRAQPRDEASSQLADIERRTNPYRQPIPLNITQRDAHGVRAELDEVKPEMCAGHFPMYPALPVAILMHSLSTLSGEALRARWGDSMRYRLLRADVFADRLAFAGERLQFAARYVSDAPGAEQYEATACLADGSQVGRLVIDLEPYAVSDVRRGAPRLQQLWAEQ
ncbi:MAG TPA: hypothetical protein VJR89_23365 [Polyangiales bacterium]|nr:hypothetical protein [Polyangiales bacterium]